jgi:hypothetical protein
MVEKAIRVMAGPLDRVVCAVVFASTPRLSSELAPNDRRLGCFQIERKAFIAGGQAESRCHPHSTIARFSLKLAEPAAII